MIDPECECLTYRTKCHPGALGNAPKDGDNEWRLSFPLENGQNLIVLMGDAGREAMAGMLMQERIDDMIESNLSNNSI